MNPDLDEIPIDKLVSEIMRRQLAYESNHCCYCKHELVSSTVDGSKYCPQCKFGRKVNRLYHPGCLASLKAVV